MEMKLAEQAYPTITTRVAIITAQIRQHQSMVSNADDVHGCQILHLMWSGGVRRNPALFASPLIGRSPQLKGSRHESISSLDLGRHEITRVYLPASRPGSSCFKTHSPIARAARA